MSTTRRSYLSMPPALESIRLYTDTLRDYSSEELEDIYFHIDVLQEPLRYRLVQMEMERRGLSLQADESLTATDGWIERAPGFAGRPLIRAAYLALLLFLLTAGVMASMLVPLWLFAQPLQFTGVQASLVYLVLLPLTVPAGLVVGLKAGGRQPRSFAALAAVMVSLWIFYATGGVDAILKPLYQAGGVAGGLFGGF